MDYTFRFSFYPIMMHFLDEVIIPKTDMLRYSFVDGIDLGKFVISSLEQELTGIYHTVGPENLYFDDFIKICHAVVNKNCKLYTVDDLWLKDNSIIKPQAFPTCTDTKEENYVFSADTTKARNKGFTNRNDQIDSRS